MDVPQEQQSVLAGREKVRYSALDVEDQIDKVEDVVEDEIFNLHDSSSTEDKVKMIVMCSMPIIFTFLLSVFGTSIMMFFAGKLSKDKNDSNIFAGVSLALTYCNISFLSIMEGFSSAVETLSSNYNGAKNYEAVGRTLHKSVVSLSIVAMPLLSSWFFVHNIFRILGISEELCEVANSFLLARICAAPVEICMMSYMKYLQSMGIMNAGMYAGIFYNLLLAVLCYLCVHVWHYSFVSLAWCHVICVVLECLLLVAITYNRKEVKRTIIPPSLSCILEVGDFLIFGFSGCVMMCAEWWAFELLTIFASMVSSQALSAQTVMLQAITIFFMFPLGIGISTGAIVGNALGAGHKQLAISIGYLSMCVIFAVDLVLCPLILIYRQDFVELFTSDPAVVYACVHQCFPILAGEIFVDGIQAVSCGVLRGAGKQKLGAAVNLGAYYFVALPVAWFLCFHEGLEVMGLMIGVCTGVCVQTSALCSLIFCRAEYVFEGLAISGKEGEDEGGASVGTYRAEGGHSASRDHNAPVSSTPLSPSVSLQSLITLDQSSPHYHHHDLGAPHRRPLSLDGMLS